MPKKQKVPIKNMGASVRARILNLSKQRRQPFQLVLTYFVLERLLYGLRLDSRGRVRLGCDLVARRLGARGEVRDRRGRTVARTNC